MDSLTQIVLGAALGEAALGKKIGNRAMIWGAIAGTIPDLDVFANFFMSPIDALAFHRAYSHSILFNFVLAFVLGWAVHQLYQKSWHRWVGVAVWGFLGITLLGFLVFRDGVSAFGILLFIGLIAGWSFLLYKRYFRSSYETPEAPFSGWLWLFLLALITHPILDCFTTYGTQIWLPFSNKRVAFNNISVVDPLYTLPFLMCLITAAFFNRLNPSRRFWNSTGILISSLYMILTIINKTRVNTVFENSLAIANIQYDRFMTTPTILNNILWYGIAETKDSYVYGLYSFLDNEKEFILHTRPKNYKTLGVPFMEDNTLQTLQWFSDGYFDVKPLDANLYEYTDLRFGNMPINQSEEDNAVFKFQLRKNEDGSIELLKNRQRPENLDIKTAFQSLWNRILGRTH